MKKIIKLLVFILLVFPCNIFAYELICNEGTYTYNDSFECYLKGNINTDYDTFQGTLETDNDLKCVRGGISEGFIVQGNSNDNFFSLKGNPINENYITYSCQVINKIDNNKTTQLKINDFKYHISNSGVDASTEILSTDYIKLEPFKEEEPIDSKPRDVSNQNSRLKTLADENLNITFSQFVTEYNIEVLYEVSELNLKLAGQNPDAIIEIIGNQKLSVGKNTIDIYVTSPLGDAKTCYSLYITRLARGEEIYYPEQDSSLSEMTISGYSINFDKNIYEYNLYITRDVNSIKVNTTPTYSGATVSITPTDNLANGSIIIVTVKSQDESNSSIYKINITKQAEKKDYSSIIFLAILFIIIIIVIVIFIKSSQKKKKNDPLLNTQNQKRTINYGDKFEQNLVPEADSQEQKVNILDLNNANTVTPISTNVNNNEISNNQIVQNKDSNQ